MKTALRVFAAMTVAALSLVAGDLTITFKSSGKVMGMSTAGTQVHYYNANFHKTTDEGTKTDMLVDYGKGMFYTIKHKDKKVEMMTFDDLVAIGEAAAAQLKKMDGMPSFMKGMMGGGDGDAEIKVEQTGSESVAGRACKKYHLTIGKIVQDLSMDPTLKPPVNPALYAKFMKLRGNAFPGAGAASMKKLYAEMSKLQGMALKTHMTGFMGADSTTEATKVDTGDIPASTFALPAGYPVEDVGKKTLKQMQSH